MRIKSLLALIIITVLTFSCTKDDNNPITLTGIVTDYDGNIYKTVKIGNQWWMAENLKSTHYSDGTPIATTCNPNVINWYGKGHNIMPDIQADANNDGVINSQDSLIYVNKYGLLYTWHAANNLYSSSCGGLADYKVTELCDDVCPSGWHLPSKEEWIVLEKFALENSYDYDSITIKLKSKSGWNNNKNGIDKYGINIFPAGSWSDADYGYYRTIGNYAYYWTSTIGNSTNGTLISISDQIQNTLVGKEFYGLSIRCMKNE